jgi:hypothetical protein
MTSYFSPEQEGYYGQVLKSGAIFYFLACLFGLLMIIYVIMRFGLKKFLGPKGEQDKSYIRYTIAIGVIGFGLSLGFMTCSLIKVNHIK